VGALKNAVYTSKPRTLQDLRREIKMARAAVPLATIPHNLSQVVVNNVMLVVVVVDILKICDFKCGNIKILPLFICEL
jgi:protein required for attachment to host cells